MRPEDEVSENLSQEKVEYLLYLDDLFNQGKTGTIGKPDPTTGYAPNPHPSIEDMILPMQPRGRRDRSYDRQGVGESVPDQPLGVYTNVAVWINSLDTKLTTNRVMHEDINNQLMRGTAVVFTEDMKALVMTHWKEAREATGDPERKGQHLIRTASIYKADRRIQFYLYCRLRMDIFKIVQPDPVGERGDQIEKGILEKIKAIRIRPDAQFFSVFGGRSGKILTFVIGD